MVRSLPLFAAVVLVSACGGLQPAPTLDTPPAAPVVASIPSGDGTPETITRVAHASVLIRIGGDVRISQRHRSRNVDNLSNRSIHNTRSSCRTRRAGEHVRAPGKRLDDLLRRRLDADPRAR